VFLDEFALETKGIADQIYGTIKSALDAKASGDWRHALMVISSTARGSSNTYARIYRAAQRGENAFHPIFVSVKESPFVTDEGYEDKKREFASMGTPWKLYSEYPTSIDEAFRESGASRFKQLPAISELSDLPSGWLRHHEQDKRWRFELDPAARAPLRLEKSEPDPDCWYVLSMDPALGGGGDFTAAQLLEVDPAARTVSLVGYWHANEIEQPDASRQLLTIGRRFHGRNQAAALFVVETSGGYGETPLTIAREANYPNIYRELRARGPKAKRELRYGKHTNPKSKPEMIDYLAGVLDDTAAAEADDTHKLRTWQLTGMYPQLRAELGSFVVKPNGRVEADIGCFDDLVMSLALGLWAVKQDSPVALNQVPADAQLVKPLGPGARFIQFDVSRMLNQGADAGYSRPY
jgi:hypothetical protein